MPRLSIVIPCPVFDRSVEDTLVSVLQNRPRSSEVIVVTGGEYSDPYDLSGEVTFLEADDDASMIHLLNQGLEACEGDVVHILLPGSIATDGWTDEVLGHFGDQEVGSVSPALVKSAEDLSAQCVGVNYWRSGVRRLAGSGAKLVDNRRQYEVLGPTLLAGFYRRELVTSLGGLDEEAGTSFADVDLAMAMTELGYRSVVEPASRVVVADLQAAKESSYRRARAAERLYRRFSDGRVLTAVLHAFFCASQLAFAVSRLTIVGHLFGRLSGRFGNVVDFHRDRISSAQDELAHNEPILLKSRLPSSPPLRRAA